MRRRSRFRCSSSFQVPCRSTRLAPLRGGAAVSPARCAGDRSVGEHTWPVSELETRSGWRSQESIPHVVANPIISSFQATGHGDMKRGITSSERACASCARRWRSDLPELTDEARCDECEMWIPTTGAFDPVWGVCGSADSSLAGKPVPARQGCRAQEQGDSRFRDFEWFGEVHDRWRERSISYTEWIPDQCGGCAYYIRLDGAFFADWGVCGNLESGRDGEPVFEHDGCDAFERALGGWSGVIPRARLERRQQRESESEDSEDS
jgi:hypothetical protein